jgi:threonine/homoserine/homoserine lactone efflux protein
MIAVELIWKGLAAGVAIAAPVGPVNVLVISRAIEKGWKSGLVSGVGAALAGFSITFIIAFLMREQKPIRIAGGLLLIAIAVIYAFKKPESLGSQNRAGATHSDFTSTLLLTLTNPTTVLSFLVVLSALGMDGKRPVWLTSLLVGGIFCGSMAWWTFLVTIGARLRDKFTDQTMVRMNRIAAVAIGAFGAFTFCSGLLR